MMRYEWTNDKYFTLKAKFEKDKKKNKTIQVYEMRR